MKQIITISGPARHGKDTTGSIIKNELEKLGKRVLIIGFGDYLKFLASKHFGYKGDEFKHEPEQRKILQELGTEIGRNNDPDFWMNIVKSTILTLHSEFDVAIIPDCRFPNECEILKDTYKVTNLKVERRNFDNQLGDRKFHISETALQNFTFDYCIDSETIDELTVKLKKFIDFIEKM